MLIPEQLLFTIEKYQTLPERNALHQTCKALYREPFNDKNLRALELYGEEPWPLTELDSDGLCCYLPEEKQWSSDFLEMYYFVLSHHPCRKRRAHYRAVIKSILEPKGVYVAPENPDILRVAIDFSYPPDSIRLSVVAGKHLRYCIVKPELYGDLYKLFYIVSTRALFVRLGFHADIMHTDTNTCYVYRFYEQCLKPLAGKLRIQCHISVPHHALEQMLNQGMYVDGTMIQIMGEISQSSEFEEWSRDFVRFGVFPRLFPFPWNERHITYAIRIIGH